MRCTTTWRGCCAIMERDDGKILLHLRCKSAWIYPNCYAFIGGGVEKGESPYAALRREWLEELGYPLSGHRLFHEAWHRKGGKRVLDSTFIVRWRPMRMQVREGLRVAWFSLEEALDRSDLPPHERHDLTLLQDMRRTSGRMPLAA